MLLGILVLMMNIMKFRNLKWSLRQHSKNLDIQMHK